VRFAHGTQGDTVGVAREADLGRRTPPIADARPESRPAGEVVAPRRNFIFESWAELKKVEWPNQNQVIQGTVVVLVACAIAGVYLWLNDQLWKQVVEKIILGQ
jgi:preprotein translocase subunit SecE